MPEFTDFVRKPFKISAVQITEENIDELCELIGHKVVETAPGRKFILVNRRIVHHTQRAAIGWWVTTMDDNLRCYPDKVFTRQFMEYDDVWEPHLEEPRPSYSDEDTSPVEVIEEAAAKTEETLASTGTPANDIHEAAADEGQPSNADEDAADEALAAIADAQAQAAEEA